MYEKPVCSTVELPVDLMFVEDGKLIVVAILDKTLQFMIEVDRERVEAVLGNARDRSCSAEQGVV